jgi:hypothetical protein
MTLNGSLGGDSLKYGAQSTLVKCRYLSEVSLYG